MLARDTFLRFASIAVIAAGGLLTGSREARASQSLCYVCGDWLICPDTSTLDEMCFQACDSYALTYCFIGGNCAETEPYEVDCA